MRWIVLFAGITISTWACAENYLVYNVNQYTRVVLSKRNCQVPGLQGLAAVVQNVKGKYIQGCWSVDRNNSDHIRIDWHNPAIPGDFSVIESFKFESVDQ